jgi:PelA/Pel-15E family pectate lyase
MMMALESRLILGAAGLCGAIGLCAAVVASASPPRSSSVAGAGAVAATEERLFVLEKYAEVIMTFAAATGERAGGVVRASPIPHEMAPTADGGELFVTSYGVKTFRDPDAGGNTITVVDARRMAPAGVVDLGSYHRPHGIARGRSGRFYVTTDAPPALLVIDPKSRAVVARRPIDGRLPHMVAVTPDETRAIVACSGSGTIAIVPIAPAATGKPILVPVGGTPMGMVVSGDGRTAYVSTRDGNEVVVVELDGPRVARRIPVPGEPSRLAFAAGERQLLASAIAGGAVVVLDVATGKELARIPVGARPEGLLVDEPGGRAFVSVQDDDKVVELGLGDWKVRREIKTGGHPDALWLARVPAVADGVDEIDGAAGALLARERVAALPPPERAAWTRYLDTSARRASADHAAVAAELAAAGRTRPIPAPFARAFKVEASMTPSWLASAEGRRFAANLVSFQTPSGGWSKHVDFALRARRPGDSFYAENEGWHYIATIDNDSTTEELRFLDGAFAATGDRRLRAAFSKGLDYLLEAQFPNGCWPQVYPLEGGYHDAITFNDDAILNVQRLLDDVAAGRLGAASVDARRRAAAAAARGVGCLVAAQVEEGGVRTIWAQQEDPLTFAPVAARRYELAGLAGRESARVAAYLMNDPAPTPAVTAAVHAAAAWFRAHALGGLAYDVKTGLRHVAGAGPIWARLCEPDTGRAIFADRDGVKRYDWSELRDRRYGYTWYTAEPAEILAQYAAWAARHPPAAR